MPALDPQTRDQLAAFVAGQQSVAAASAPSASQVRAQQQADDLGPMPEPAPALVSAPVVVRPGTHEAPAGYRPNIAPGTDPNALAAPVGLPPPTRAPITPATAAALQPYVAAQRATVGYGGSGGAVAAPAAPLQIPGGPRVVGMTRAGYVPRERRTTVEGGVEYTPETKEDLSEAEKAGRAAEADQERAAKLQTEKEGRAAVAYANEAAANDAAMKVAADRRASALQAKQDAVDSAQREVDEGRVDPKRLWHSMSTGQRVAATIDLIASGFVAGLRGGPNQGWEALQGAIDRDVDAQKQELAGKKGKVEAAKGAYAMLRQRGLDEQEAEAGARMMHHQQLAAELDAASPSARDAQARLALDQAKQRNRMEMAKARASFEEKASARTQTTLGEAYQQAAPIMGGGPDLRKQILARAQEIRKETKGGISVDDATKQATAEYAAVYGTKPTGVGGYATAGAGAKPSQRDAESIRAHEAAISYIDQMLALREKHGGGALSPEDRRVAKGLAARAQENLVAALGKTNQGLLDRTSELIPDNPLEMRVSGIGGSDEIGAGLRNARKMLDEELRRTRATPGAPGPTGEGAQE